MALGRLMDSTDLVPASAVLAGWEESLRKGQWYLPALSSLEIAAPIPVPSAFSLNLVK